MGSGRWHTEPNGAGHQALCGRGFDPGEPIELGDEIADVDDPRPPGSTRLAVHGSEERGFHPCRPGQELTPIERLTETGLEVFPAPASP